MNTFCVALTAAACAVLLAPAALAAHGKAGTWEVTTKMSGGGMAGMPDMSKLPPAAQARMKAHGVSMNAGGGMTSKFCMTAEQVNANKPPMTRADSPCKTENMKVAGHSFSADIVCTGKVNGRGHTEMTFDSPEHYSGHQTMTMTVNGHTIDHEMTMEARWLTPACTVPAPGKH